MKFLPFFIVALLSCKNSQKILDTKSYNISDTTHYCQIHSPWVTTCFFFYKKSKETKNGLFEKEMESDDGQHWYGKGEFVEKNNKVMLSKFMLIRTLNNKQDTSQIEPLTFLKSGDTLILNDNNSKIIFIKQRR